MARVVPVPAAADDWPEQIDDAPRDRRRRIDEIHRPGRELPQAMQQQRIVGAGQHDGVGALGVVAEAGRDLGADFRIAGRRAVEFGLGIAGERGRADQRYFAILRIIANERAGIFALAPSPRCRARTRAW